MFPAPWQGSKISTGFCQLFSFYSNLNNSKVITVFFFASSTLPEQFEYLLIQPTGYSFYQLFISALPCQNPRHFYLFIFRLRSQCLHLYFKETVVIFWTQSLFSTYRCKSPELFYYWEGRERGSILESLMMLFATKSRCPTPIRYQLVDTVRLQSSKGRLGKTTEPIHRKSFKILGSYTHFRKFFHSWEQGEYLGGGIRYASSVLYFSPHTHLWLLLESGYWATLTFVLNQYASYVLIMFLR